jgi:opacity protein-like surface antigen
MRVPLLPSRATLAATLLIALPAAAAAPKPLTPVTTAPAPAAAKPAPAKGAAVRVEPAAEPAPAAAPFEEKGPWRIAVALGREKDGDSELAGLRAQLELERDLVKLGSRGQLSFVAAAGWWHGTDEQTDSYPSPLGTFTVSTDITADLYELIPAFRAGFAVTPRLRLFAEVGAGATYLTTTMDVTTSLAPNLTDSTTEDSWAGVLRFAAGGSWQVNDRFRIGVELPAIHRRYGRAQSQSLALSAMAAYAF